MTLHCGHSLCRACAVSWFTAPSKLCPIGRCAASANCKPAELPTAYALRDVVDSARVYCRYGLCEGSDGRWIIDHYGCPEQLRRADVAAHEKVCGHAVQLCPFAGCGQQLRRMDAAQHDYMAGAQHAVGERNERLELLAKLRKALDERQTSEGRLRRERNAALSRLETLQSTLSLEQKSRAALESKHSIELMTRDDALSILRQERDAARFEAAKLKRELDARSAPEAKTPSKGDAQPPASKKRRTTAVGASVGAAPAPLRARRGAEALTTTRSGRRFGPV